jgi:hypothetical protein
VLCCWCVVVDGRVGVREREREICAGVADECRDSRVHGCSQR